jgi:hypothetical protein
MSVFF